MKSRCCWACLLPLLLAGLSCGDKPDVYAISIPKLKADPQGSITGLEIRINAGTVQGVQNIPIGWNMSIEDDANWISKVRGNSTIGAASLSPDELKRIVFLVRRNERENFNFDVSGTFTVSKNSERPQKIQATMQDFSLTGTQ